MAHRKPLVRRIREAVIGDDQVMVGPFGPRRVTYADYTASGCALAFLEDFIRADRAGLEVQAGVPVIEVAERFRVSRQAVHRWFGWYRKEGLEGLVD